MGRRQGGIVAGIPGRRLRALASRVAAAAACGARAAVPSAESAASSGSLADLSLEELANLQITSVSRRAERLSEAATVAVQRLDIAPAQELELALRHVGALPQPKLPSYYAMDLRYGWRVHSGWTLSVDGRNLFGAPHREFGTAPGRSVIARSLVVQLEARL
jgi:hypothetical protein